MRAPDSNTKVKVYDADHERRRKDQLNKLFHRTQEQVTHSWILLAIVKCQPTYFCAKDPFFLSITPIIPSFFFLYNYISCLPTGFYPEHSSLK